MHITNLLRTAALLLLGVPLPASAQAPAYLLIPTAESIVKSDRACGPYFREMDGVIIFTFTRDSGAIAFYGRPKNSMRIISDDSQQIPRVIPTEKGESGPITIRISNLDLSDAGCLAPDS